MIRRLRARWRLELEGWRGYSRTPKKCKWIVPPGGPKKGNLVARLKGSGAKKPLLFSHTLDVVEARRKREDWERDPVRELIEEALVYLLTRAARTDDKSMAAA